MPPGTPYHGFVHPYPIRVDAFSGGASVPPTALHLLTHTHTDHTTGLSARGFAQPVVCSHDAKEMLLRHEVYKARELYDADAEGARVRTYAHLKVDPVKRGGGEMAFHGSRDLLRPHRIHEPFVYDLDASESVTITLLDANHCPGAVMYLIEGARGAILHTGDVRAEPSFLAALSRNPFLQRYLAPPLGAPFSSSVLKRLDAIYLDTACMLSDAELLPKDEAVAGMVELMRLCPPTAAFFLNAWTWGYEDMLKAAAAALGCKVHVDRYKHGVLSALSDPFLRAILTLDGASTRLHACERFARCPHVPYASTPARPVVYVNPVGMGRPQWTAYLSTTRAALQAGERVESLLVPLARHSGARELRALVALFRPAALVPNTLAPALRGLDALALPGLLGAAVTPCVAEADVDLAALDADADVRDAALKNVAGAGAEGAAARWAESRSLRTTLAFLAPHLPPRTRTRVERIVGAAPADAPIPGLDQADDGPREETQASSHDSPSSAGSARERRMHELFASQPGPWADESRSEPPTPTKRRGVGGSAEREVILISSGPPAEDAPPAHTVHALCAAMDGPAPLPTPTSSQRPLRGAPPLAPCVSAAVFTDLPGPETTPRAAHAPMPGVPAATKRPRSPSFTTPSTSGLARTASSSKHTLPAPAPALKSQKTVSAAPSLVSSSSPGPAPETTPRTTSASSACTTRPRTPTSITPSTSTLSRMASSSKRTLSTPAPPLKSQKTDSAVPFIDLAAVSHSSFRKSPAPKRRKLDGPPPITSSSPPPAAKPTPARVPPQAATTANGFRAPCTPPRPSLPRPPVITLSSSPLHDPPSTSRIHPSPAARGLRPSKTAPLPRPAPTAASRAKPAPTRTVSDQAALRDAENLAAINDLRRAWGKAPLACLPKSTSRSSSSSDAASSSPTRSAPVVRRPSPERTRTAPALRPRELDGSALLTPRGSQHALDPARVEAVRLRVREQVLHGEPVRAPRLACLESQEEEAQAEELVGPDGGGLNGREMSPEV